MVRRSFLLVQVFLLILVSHAKSFQPRDSKSTLPPPGQLSQKRLDVGDSLSKDRALSPEHLGDRHDDSGLVEVKESDIPEGAMVYVLEEPVDSPVDGESLKTAANIVFRPLFRYRSKQEAQRRNSRVRRRYFVPRRSYRHAYYPYYYYPRYY